MGFYQVPLCNKASNVRFFQGERYPYRLMKYKFLPYTSTLSKSPSFDFDPIHNPLDSWSEMIKQYTSI